MVRAACLLVVLAATMAACATDDAPEPEPELEFPGSFVAVAEQEGPLTLRRMLDRLLLDNGEMLLFMSSYDVAPRSWEEAREAAKDHDLPVQIELEMLLSSDLTARPHRVVWFRSLTEEEEERVP
ncbi:hypothetical protein [Sorangium sp. So ce117]|uniref:hypothetical protein n=1 Tax=Sorangium sp. So ce117 TaxID=3133277 RepID=UPI003F64597B